MAYHRASLIASVESGDLAAVTEALSRSPDLHAKRNRDCIKTAVMNDGKQYQQILSALLEYGLTVNPSDANNVRFLHAASEKGYLQVVEDLLKYGAKVDVIRFNGIAVGSALQRAARNNHQEIAELLIKHGANPLIGRIWKKTPMFYFTINSYIKLINLLFASNPKFKRNRHILHTAVESQSLEMVQTLLQHGVKVATRDNAGWTALHVNSCSTNVNPEVKVQIAELLLSKGADVDARNAREATPLHLASDEADSVAVAEVLLRHNANVHAVNEYGKTSLHIAAEKGHKEMCAILIKHGAMINVRKKNGETPLHISIRRGHAEVVNLLLESGAILKLENEDEPSAFHVAIRECHEKVVDILLKWGADFNAKRFWSNSLAEFSEKCWMSSEMIVKMFINRGVDINETGWEGYTALHFAAVFDHHLAIRTLLKFGANINALTDSDSSTPLCLVAHDAYLSGCKTLLEYGAAVNLANADNETPLLRAAKYGYLDNVVALLNHGADINIASDTNEIPLAKAIEGMFKFNDFREEVGVGCNIDRDCEEYIEGHLCEDIVETLIRHIVKLRMNNMFVSDDNLRAVKDSEYLEIYQSACEAELAKMVCDVIPNCDMTYFDFLGKSISSIARLMNNECILQGLQSKEYKWKYCRYGEELERLINQGLLRKKHLEQGEMLIRLVYPAMPQVCIDNILSFLGNVDIRID